MLTSHLDIVGESEIRAERKRSFDTDRIRSHETKRCKSRARDIPSIQMRTATITPSERHIDNDEFSRFVENDIPNFAVLCNFELYRNFRIAIF